MAHKGHSVAHMDHSTALGHQAAEWVKTTAAKRGTSLRSLAEQSDITWPTFVRRLAGVSPFTVVEFDRVARVLGATAGEIIAEIEGRAA